jgi:predicted nucleic acid-binding protein
VPVIDASVWVAISYESDAAHARCVLWLESVVVSNDRLVAPTLLVTEVAGAIRRLTGTQTFASRVVEKLVELSGVAFIGLDQERARRAASLAAETGLRGADAVYLALAQEMQETLVTVDRQQADRSAGIVDVRIP